MTATNPEKLQICYVLDKGFIDCTCVSIFSLLQHTGSLLNIRILLDDVSEEELAPLKRFSHHPNILNLDFHHLDLTEFPQITFDKLSRAAYGRLLLPSFSTGKVIYIDGDTLVQTDIRNMWDIGLQNMPVAACLDSTISAWISKAKSKSRKRRARYQRVVEARKKNMPNVKLDEYFNSGVMIFDTDRIREFGFDLLMADAETAKQYRLHDQDHLNVIFAGKTKLMDPTWNAQWGNLDTRRRYFSKELRDYYENSRRKPAILHFTGKRKPWNPMTKKDIKAALGLQQIGNFLKMMSYRRLYRDYQKRCEEFLGQRLFVSK